MRPWNRSYAPWVAGGAGLLLALSAVSARADSTGQFWGWTAIAADAVTYNLQIPAPAVATGDQFVAARIFGSQTNGPAELICRQDGAFTEISCSAGRDRYAVAWATVRIQNTDRGEMGDFTTQFLQPAANDGQGGWQRLQLFQAPLVAGGSARGSDAAGNRGNDNGASRAANDNAASRVQQGAAGNGNGNAAPGGAACADNASNGNAAPGQCL